MRESRTRLSPVTWMPLPAPKITFGEMRASGVSGILIYCSDYACGHSRAGSADQWPDDVRLSGIEPRFTCQHCGRKGADVRPDFATMKRP
ncbi:MAG: hypothetical protein JWQ59_1329 [Cryobacterium sp.]|nr:hypothetical protein [Cryobacterium sp.]